MHFFGCGVRVVSYTPAGRLNGDPSVFDQRTRGFGEGAVAHGVCQLVVRRDVSGRLQYWVMFPEGVSTDAAERNLHESIAARAELVDVAPSLEVAAVAVLRQRSMAVPVHSTQAGVSVEAVAATVASVLGAGEWVAMTVRRAGVFESRWWGRWFEGRKGTSGTHHSVRPGSVVMSLWGGGGSGVRARGIVTQVAAVLPGFDHYVSGVVVSDWGWVVGGLAGVVAGFGGGLLGGGLPVAGWVWLVCGLVGGLVVLLSVSGRGLSRRCRLFRGLPVGRLPSPPRRWWPPRGGRDGGVGEGGRVVRAVSGGYPLHRWCFKVGAGVVACLVAPHAGASSGVLTTRLRDVPPVMRERIGPLVGFGADGCGVYLSAGDGFGGVALFGQSGSGKSTVSQQLSAFAWAERRFGGFVGVNNSVICFEAKLDGALATMQWAEDMGERALLVEVANPQSVAIDFFDVPGGVVERARHFVDAMRSAFDEGSIRHQSAKTLKVVVAAGLVVTDRVAEAARVPPGRGPVFYAHVFNGGLGDEVGVRLYGQLRQVLEREACFGGDPPLEDVRAAVEGLSVLYGAGVKEGERRRLQEAPDNKLDVLLALDHWFSPGRVRVGWRQVLDSPGRVPHRSVVVLTGVDSVGNLVDAGVQQVFGSMLLFTLRAEIERTCSGWQEVGRHVTIVCDELRDLAAYSPTVVDWLRNRGRSYGVRPILATQYPDQLPREVQDALLSFSTVIGFSQAGVRQAEVLARDLGGDWGAEDVLALPRFHAVVRATVGQQRLDPFVVSTREWRGDADGFLRVQGFEG